MRTLVVGAGAIGGYFGGRLLEAKRDVTFLVRKFRATTLRHTGLVIRSPRGDFEQSDPPVVQAETLRGPYDLILLSCKAYDLEGAIDSFAPAVNERTSILPLLNGMAHIDTLQKRFGPQAVLGGQCMISAALDAEGRILHFNDLHSLTFGELARGGSERAGAVLAELAHAAFETRLSESIAQSMWDKWILIATMAGINCLMRASVGDIAAAGGAGLVAVLYDECAAIATTAGFAPAPEVRQRTLAALTQPGSPLMASMLRDVESGSRTEVQQIIGDLIRRRSPMALTKPRSSESQTAAQSLLDVVHVHLKAYEARRQRDFNARTG